MAMLDALGGEEGCRRLASALYQRIGKDPALRPLFPGKSLRCATEEFTAFLIQFLGGDEDQAQFRWWLSLRESHARFRIGPAERKAWLENMGSALDSIPLDGRARTALRQFFLRSSSYVIGKEAPDPDHGELAARWKEQCSLDDAIAAIASGRDEEALRLVPRFASRPSVYVGLLARMVQTARPALIRHALEAVSRDASLGRRRFNTRTLLHFAAGAGCLELVKLLLRTGVDPGIADGGGHTPLYRVANECASPDGPGIVHALIDAGADVNERTGVTKATALHMAARRGFVEIARALLERGASPAVPDSKGDTPLRRAINCRKTEVERLLRGG